MTAASPKSLSSLQSIVSPALSTIDIDPITSTDGEASGSDIIVSYQADTTPTARNPTIADHETLETSTQTTDFATNNHGIVSGYDEDTTTYPSTGHVVPNRSDTANREAQFSITSGYSSSTTPDYGIYTTPLTPNAVIESRRAIHPLINSMAIPDGEKSTLQMSLTDARFKASDALENYVSTDNIDRK